MNQYSVSNRNFGVEIEFQRDGVSHTEVADLLERNGIPVRVSGYEHTVGQRVKWTLKPDGSLGSRGLELVSPILHGQEGIEQVKKVAGLLAQAAFVDERCGIHVHHEVGKIADRIQKRTIRNVYRVYRAAQKELNNRVIEESRHYNSYCAALPDLDAVTSIRLRRLSRYHVVNFASVDIFGTIEFRQYQGCLEQDRLEAWVLLTQAIVEYAAQVQSVCEKEVEKIDQLFENRLYVTGEELKKMKALLIRGF